MGTKTIKLAVSAHGPGSQGRRKEKEGIRGMRLSATKGDFEGPISETGCAYEYCMSTYQKAIRQTECKVVVGPGGKRPGNRKKQK